MDNNNGEVDRRKITRNKCVLAVRHLVSSIHHTCGFYLIILQAVLETLDIRDEIIRQPHPFRQQIDHLNRLVRGNDKDCHEQLRMNKHTFMRLCFLVRQRGVGDSKYVLVEEKVGIFLRILGHDWKNRATEFSFLRSGQTISKYFNEILKAVISLHDVLLKTPEPVPEDEDDDRWRWFQNCLGSLDGTYVEVRAPAKDKARYRNRKGEIATNVLGVCGRGMQFIYVLPGWEGSASDSRVLRDAVHRPNGLKVPTGTYYLVDGGYTNGEGFLAPYKGQRYHLSTWRDGPQPANAKDFFNMKHTQARNVIERAFGLLKMRWAILRHFSYFPIQTRIRIVTACCLLHNLVKREMPVDPLEELLVDPPEDPDEWVANVESSEQWSSWRDALANQMYNHWLCNR